MGQLIQHLPITLSEMPMTDNSYQACDLCSLPVENSDLFLYTVNGVKQFCCEGCQGIYQILHEVEILGEANVTDTSGETVN